MSDATLFYQTVPGQDGSYDEFWLQSAAAGGRVMRKHVMLDATVSGASHVGQTQWWEIAAFMGENLESPAKIALSRVLEAKRAKMT